MYKTVSLHFVITELCIILLCKICGSGFPFKLWGAVSNPHPQPSMMSYKNVSSYNPCSNKQKPSTLQVMINKQHNTGQKFEFPVVYNVFRTYHTFTTFPVEDRAKFPAL